MNRILITLMTFTLIWSCSNNSKTTITSSIDTSKFEGMNPDSVFNLAYEYYNAGDDANSKVIIEYAKKHGSKMALFSEALDEIAKGEKEKGKIILEKLYKQKYPPAYYELGLLMLRENNPEYKTFLDSAITLGENWVAGFLGFLYLEGKYYQGGIEYSTNIDTITGVKYLKISALNGDYESQTRLGKYYFEIKEYDNAELFFKMSKESFEEYSKNNDQEVFDYSNEYLMKIDSARNTRR